MNNKKIDVAVIGATGIVGRNILQVLSENHDQFGNIYAIASSTSRGRKISFGEKTELDILSIEDFDFSQVKISIFAASSEISEKYVQKAIDSGSYVIDKSSAFRMNDDVPLIIPEVNGHLIEIIENKISKPFIIANPNCCVIPLAIALDPLNSAAKIKRVVVSTYQSVSGAGKDAMDELYNQTKSTYMLSDVESKIFEKPIAFNIIPKIDEFNEFGYSGEEDKIRNEIRKIFKNQFDLSVTSVRVPVFIGHSLSVNVEFEKNINAIEAEEILYECEGVTLVASESPNNYITPKEIVGEDLVYISRIRDDLSQKNTLNMWISCDNLRKGAATNGVQIMQLLSQNFIG